MRGGNDDEENEDDGQPPDDPDCTRETGTDCHVEALKITTWNIGESKLADAIDAISTIRYDCTAITEILLVCDCKHQKIKSEYHVIHAERPRLDRNGAETVFAGLEGWLNGLTQDLRRRRLQRRAQQ